MTRSGTYILFETRRYQKELLQKVGEAWYLPPYRVMVFESRLRFWKPRIRIGS